MRGMMLDTALSDQTSNADEKCRMALDIALLYVSGVRIIASLVIGI